MCKPMKININIDEIVLDGFNNNNKDGINKRKIVLAVEEELSRIFKEKDYTYLHKTGFSNIKRTDENPKSIIYTIQIADNK